MIADEEEERAPSLPSLPSPLRLTSFSYLFFSLLFPLRVASSSPPPDLLFRCFRVPTVPPAHRAWCIERGGEGSISNVNV
jgi:hypothetical protein